MPNDRYSIRAMSGEEVAIAVDWAAAEGWNPRLDDAACIHAADSDGFLVGPLGDEPVATISAVPAALELVERHGLHLAFETARIYAGPLPDAAMTWLYAVTACELG